MKTNISRTRASQRLTKAEMSKDLKKVDSRTNLSQFFIEVFIAAKIKKKKPLVQ